MTTPELQLRTLYVLDGDGRMAATREPGGARPPCFALVRGRTGRAWAVRDDVPHDVAAELDALAREEPPPAELQDPPKHAERYLSLLGGRAQSGPAFAFPDEIDEPEGVLLVDDPALLDGGFVDLAPELDGRSPLLAILEDGRAVSICHCARRSDEAAEAGLFTLESHRGRGYGPRVTAAWALAIQATGRTPLYSTSWTNAASLAVARKLGLKVYASDWNVVR